MLTRSKISLAAIAFFFVYVIFNLSDWEKKNLLGWDEAGYYVYLPGAFIYHDIDQFRFAHQIVHSYYYDDSVVFYTGDGPPGHKLNKYPLGTSLSEMPFFLLAHWYCNAHPKEFPPDGYSTPYMAAVIFSAIFWVFSGLFILRKFLLRYFSETATALTLLLLAFGTNLYFYTFFSVGMSHPFSFALFCFLLYETERWHSRKRVINAILAGLIMGFITITRPTNIVIAMIPICWSFANGKIGDGLAFYRKQIPAIALSLVCFFSILMLQLSYWKYVTGHWICYSYQNEGFDFGSPHIWDGLFSYRKGWFLYTPVALVGTIGILALALKQKKLATLVLAYLVVNIYIVFSWQTWFYGGSFGCRALIEAIAILAIPLAALIEWIFSGKKLLVNIPVLLVFSFLIALNVFQSYQLYQNVTLWDGTNKAYYWRSFGKLHVTDEDRKLLNQ